MLTPPPIPDALILARLWDDYALRADSLAFLPLGADINTAVFRVTAGGADYFLKLRKADFAEISVTLPHFLHEQGLSAIIPPLPARAGALWTELALDADTYRLILYPFITGTDGYETPLTPAQWRDFGALMARIHAAALPNDLRAQLPVEDFSPRWRDQVRGYQARIMGQPEASANRDADPVTLKMERFIREHNATITHIVERAEALARDIQQRGLPFVLCHADLHPGNLHLPDGARLYLVDWDNPIYAPRERDLALIGGSGVWAEPASVDLFYQGYGSQIPVDRAALAYYRYERIIADIAAFGAELLDSDAGGPDREQSYGYFTGAFIPGHEIDLAKQADG